MKFFGQLASHPKGQVVNWVKTKPRLPGNQIPFGETIHLGMIGEPAKKFHWVGIGPLSKILAVK